MPDDITPPEPAAGSDTPPPGADTLPPEGTPPAPAADGPKSMLDAINAGIDSVSTGTAQPPEDDEPAPAKEPPPKPKEPAEPLPAAAKGKEPAPAKEPAAELKPKEPKAPKEPAGPIDAINDPIPPEVKGRTRERMTQLISNVKEVSAQRDQAVTDRNDILGMIEETGANPEQYSQALDYLRAVNSRDPVQIKQAIGVAMRELQALSAMIGEPVPGVDMLAQHPDLIAEIEDGKISRARADEIAAARAMRQSHAQQGQRFEQARQQQAAVTHARSQLNAVEQELRASDPLYEQKKGMLVPLLKPIMQTLPPAQWERAFRGAYAQLRLPAAMSAPAPAVRTPSAEPLRAQQPLRATQHAGTARREAGSMLDAINEGIEAGSRRR